MDRLKILAQESSWKKMDRLKRGMHTLSINWFLQCQISGKILNSEQGSHRKKCERSCCSLVLNHELTICDIQWLQHFFTYTLFSHGTISLPLPVPSKKKIAPNLWLNEEQAALSFDGMKWFFFSPWATPKFHYHYLKSNEIMVWNDSWTYTRSTYFDRLQKYWGEVREFTSSDTHHTTNIQISEQDKHDCGVKTHEEVC